MPPYNPDPQIIEKSLHELEFILEWVRQRGETEENPVTVLVGGWAVDAYNPWYGSIDIDLVTNNRTKHSLMRILVKEREYDHFRIGTHTVYKLKASWDRAYRIDSETSDDLEWERGKLIKDYADIIALLDPIHGGTELDFNFLGEKLGDFDFLKGCLRKIPETHDAIVKYNRMDQRKVRETIERLLKLTE